MLLMTSLYPVTDTIAAGKKQIAVHFTAQLGRRQSAAVLMAQSGDLPADGDTLDVLSRPGTSLIRRVLTLLPSSVSRLGPRLTDPLSHLENQRALRPPSSLLLQFFNHLPD